jgi:hypothetical protein
MVRVTESKSALKVRYSSQNVGEYLPDYMDSARNIVSVFFTLKSIIKMSSFHNK